MKKLLVLLALTFTAGAHAEPGPVSWTYYDGASRVVSANNGFIQLETDKAYCGGRIRLEKDPGFYSQSYTLEVQGSWCKQIKVGFDKVGDRFNENSVTKRFNLEKTQGGDGVWAGFGRTITIPVSAIYDYSNGVSRNQISLVLTTSKRDDTGKPAYEKITLEF